jgi:peptidyl-prolyl cis-trans isomerase SurA
MKSKHPKGKNLFRSKRFILLVVLLLTSLPTMRTYGELVDATLALVGEDVILLSQFDEELMLRTQELPQSQLATMDMNAFGNQVLQDLIDNQLLIQAADKANISVADSEVEPYVQQQIDAFKANFASDADYQKFLDDQGFTERDIYKSYFERIRDQMVISRYLSKEVAPKIRISEDEIDSYYTAHQDELELPSYINFELLELIKAPSAEETEKIRQKLLELKARAEAGEDFGELAKKYSQFSYDAANGGYLDFFERGKYYPEFEDAAFALDVGQVSDPVLTPDGMQIIKLEAKKDNSIAVRHILLKVETSPEQLVKLRLFADNLVKLLKENGTAQEALSKAEIPENATVNPYSVPDTDLKKLAADYPQLTSALEKLDPGSVTSPIESENTIFIAKLNKLTLGGKPNQSQAHDMVKDILWGEKSDKEKANLLEKLRARTFITVYGE